MHILTKQIYSLALVILFIFTSSCTRSPLPPPEGSPSASTQTATVHTSDTPTPAVPTQTATVTATPLPPIDLPVRFGKYPFQDEILGASSDQQVVELARWGNGTINQLAVSPDETELAIASTAGIYFYDQSSYQLTASHLVPSSAVVIQYSPEGNLLAAAVTNSVLVLQTNDHTLAYKLDTGRQSTPGELPLDFSSDGKTLATLGKNAIQLWDTVNGTLIKEIPLETGPERDAVSLQFMDNANLLIYYKGRLGGLQLIDPGANRYLFTTPPIQTYNWAVVPGGKYTVVSNDSLQKKSILVFDTTTGQQISEFDPGGHLRQIFLSPDGSLLVINLGKKVCTWTIPGGKAAVCINNFVYAETGFLSDGKNLLIRTKTMLEMVDARWGTVTKNFDKIPIGQLLLASANKIYALGGRDMLEIWSEAGQKLGKIPGFLSEKNYSSISFLPAGTKIGDFSADQDILALSNQNTFAVFYDLQTGATLEYNGKLYFQFAMSANQKFAATVEYSSLSLTNLEQQTTQQLSSMKSPMEILSIAFSPDGKLFGAVMKETKASQIHLWDTATAAEIGKIPISGSEINKSSLAFSPDSKTLVVKGSARMEAVLIYDISDLAKPKKIRGLDYYVESLTFTPDGKSLVIAEGIGKITFLDSQDWRTTRLVINSGVWLQAISFLENGKVLAIAGMDGLLHLWGIAPAQGVQVAQATSTPAAQVAAPKQPLSYAGTPYPIPSAPFSSRMPGSVVELARWGKGVTGSIKVSPDGQRIALVTLNGIYLYQAQTLLEEGFIETPSPVWGVIFSPDSSLLGFIYHIGSQITITTWSLPQNRQLHAYQFEESIFMARSDYLRFDYAPDSQTLAVLAGGDVVVLDAQTGKEIKRQPLPKDLQVGALRYARVGQSLVLISLGVPNQEAPGLSWLDLAASTLTPGAPQPNLTSVVFSENGKYAAAGSFDPTAKAGEVKIYNAINGTPTGVEIGLDAGVMALQFNPGGDRLAVSFADGRLCLWSAADGSTLPCLVEKGEPQARTIRFSPDGSYLLVDGMASMRIWDTTTGSKIIGTAYSLDSIRAFETLPGEGGLVIMDRGGLTRWKIVPQPLQRLKLSAEAAALAYSEDKKLLAAGGTWGIQTWDTSTNAIVDSISGDAQVLVFSNSSNLLAAARSDGLVALYSLPGGKLLWEMEGLQQPARQLLFIQNGKVLVASNDEETRLWNTTDGTALPAPEGSSAGLLSISDGEKYQKPGTWFAFDKELVSHSWEVQSGKVLPENTSMQNKVKDVQAVSLKNSQLVVLNPSAISSFNAYGMKDWEAPLAAANKALLSSNSAGNLVAAASSDGLLIFNGKGEVQRSFPGQVDALAQTLDGALVAFAAGSEVQVWNPFVAPEAVRQDFETTFDNAFSLVYAPEIQKLANEIPNQPALLWGNGFTYKAFIPSSGTLLANIDTGTMALAYSQDMTVEAFITKTGKIGTLIDDAGGPAIKIPSKYGAGQISLSADGKILTAVMGNGTNQRIAFWDTATGNPIANNVIPDGFYSMAVISPDGHWLTVLSREKKLLIYDFHLPAAPELLLEIPHQTGESIAFSSDGQILAMGDAEGKVTLFDVAGGWKQMFFFKAHTRSVQSILFLPDGNVLATAGEDGTLRLWGVK